MLKPDRNAIEANRLSISRLNGHIVRAGRWSLRELRELRGLRSNPIGLQFGKRPAARSIHTDRAQRQRNGETGGQTVAHRLPIEIITCCDPQRERKTKLLGVLRRRCQSFIILTHKASKKCRNLFKSRAISTELLRNLRSFFRFFCR